MIVLNGITWDHDRGYLPLLQTTKSFEKMNPDIKIRWRKRSLKDFGDYPVEKLAKEYDLLLIDHPFIGEAYKQNILVDFNQYISQKEMKIREEQELGNSHRCYIYREKQLALSVDIAAMVSVVRNDLMEMYGYHLPKTWDEVIQMAETSRKVAAPLIGTDIWDIFLSLGAAYRGQDFITEEGIDSEAARWALEQIYRLRRVVPQECMEMNPIQIMDRMSETDEILYVPFCFGYVSYAWKKRKYPLSFYDMPLWEGAKTAPILGGVGIAVSADSRNIEAAVKYVEYVTRPEVQTDEYFLSGGQPGQKDAWMSRRNNELTGGFFDNTRATIENAYLRPRFPGWNFFQEESGEWISMAVKEEKGVEVILKGLNERFDHFF